MKTIKRIVFTGGPCGGKTSFASRAMEVFSDHGYRVIIDNESATDLISGGISPATMGMYEFQKYVIDLQLKKEELCYNAAQNIEGDKVLIFIDRGLFDDKSYVSDEEFRQLLSEFGIREEEVNSRYDMVLHLVTSAKGAEEAYSFNTNAARYETVEVARAVDDRTLECWKDHPNRVIIGNETDFEWKIIRAMQAVFQYLGEEQPVEVFRKYLVELNDDVLQQVLKENNCTQTHIYEQFLKSEEGMEKRIRRRIKNGTTRYYYSEAKVLSSNKRYKTDRILSERQYHSYSPEINKDLNPIDKDRYSFLKDSHFYKLDIFSFDKSKALLSIQVPLGDEEVRIPLYFKVIKEVSDDPSYKNFYLAKSQSYGE